MVLYTISYFFIRRHVIERLRYNKALYVFGHINFPSKGKKNLPEKNKKRMRKQAEDKSQSFVKDVLSLMFTGFRINFMVVFIIFYFIFRLAGSELNLSF